MPEVLQQQVQAAKAGDADALRGIRLYGIYLSRAGHHQAAAVWFGAADIPIHQAIELERAGDDEAAANLWQEIVASDQLRGRQYELALVRINNGLCLLRLGHERSRAALAEHRVELV